MYVCCSQTRVWAQPSKMADAEYASSIAGPLLDWVEDFTGTPYSIAKMGERILPLI